MMLRKLGILLAALLLAVVIGDTLVWFWAVRQIRTGWETWAASERAAGWTVSAGHPEAGGWPVAASVTLPDVALQGGRAAIPGGIAWGAQRLVLRLSARHPHVLKLEAAGAQHLRVSHGPDIAYAAQRLYAVLPLQASASVPPVVLQGEALRIGLADGTGSPLTIGHLTAQVVLDPEAARGKPAVTLTVNAQAIGLPNHLVWALGDRMAWFRLTADLNGPLPAATGPTASATAWRDGGGTVVIRTLASQWGPLGLSATGAVQLDARLQPAGSAEARVTGFAATLDALARHRVMSHTAAVAATALLSLLAVTPADGGPASVDVPLTLRDQVLFMQRVPLLRVPPLDWPPP